MGVKLFTENSTVTMIKIANNFKSMLVVKPKATTAYGQTEGQLNT